MTLTSGTPDAALPAAPDSAASAPSGALPPAPLVRRLLCMLYESMLLFGVVFGTGLVYGVATQQRNALHGRSGLLVTLFLVLAAYFIGFWLHGGQTLAMKTWHIRLQRTDGRPLTPLQALARYVGGWAWVLPPLVLLWALGLTRHGPAYIVTFLLWVAGYAMLSRRHPRRQFLHDALCGTEMVSVRPQDAAPPAGRP